MKRIIRIALLMMAMAYGKAVAQSPVGAATCPDSGAYSRLKVITDLCWTCFFPIKIAGIPIAMGGDNGGNIPIGDLNIDFDRPGRGSSKLPSKTASPFCVCPGRFYGIPSPGITWGMWFPTHTMEVVRQPWCSPILFGMSLGSFTTNTEGLGISILALEGGTAKQGGPSGNAGDQGSFYNWHWLTFPIYEMLEALMSPMCSPQGWGVDMSYIYFTEFDPTWDNEMLALYTHPEIKVFANLYAKAACAADAVMATISKPIDEAIWCAGSWGMLYPFSGKGGVQATVEAQMLVGARGLAAMHRRGLAMLTYTNQGTCNDIYWFVYPKQQYQFQNFWPYPQRQNNVWTGTSSWKWGQHRRIPARGEERVIMQWTYKECCFTFW